ncbi:MAG: lipopolysaccharide transport periplasmic protein LptA [Rhodanobacteraceae bacterium]
MYTAPYSPVASARAARRGLIILLLALAAITLPAMARENDRNQKISVSADHFESSQQTGITTLSGHVIIKQGTLEATAGKGTAHANASGNTERIVLNGNPAHLQQQMDDGSLMRAHASIIDYQVNGDTITLNGDAHVQQPGQGTFNGAHLVYNPTSGAIKGNGGKQGRVHLTLEPRKRK